MFAGRALGSFTVGTSGVAPCASQECTDVEIEAEAPAT
jgi:hypothetical protein